MKLSWNNVFIASRKLTASRKGSQRSIAMVDISSSHGSGRARIDRSRDLRHSFMFRFSGKSKQRADSLIISQVVIHQMDYEIRFSDCQFGDCQFGGSESDRGLPVPIWQSTGEVLEGLRHAPTTSARR